MPQPSVRDGHVDHLLTNISVAYLQTADKFVAGNVFPVVPVEHASDFYLEFPRGHFFRDEVGPRPIGGYSRVVGFELDKKPYLCEEEAVSAMLDDRERKNVSAPYNPEASKIKHLTQMHMIHRDKLWAEKYFASGVWTTDLDGVAASPGANQFLQWDQAASNPIEEIDLQKEKIAELTGFEPNVLVLGRQVYRNLRNHADILDRIKYTQRGQITPELLASLFEVQKVVIPGGIRNTAKEGAADSYSFIVGKKSALLAYAAPEAGLDQPSAGYTFAWTGLLGEAAFESGVWRGRDDRAHSDWFEVRMSYDMKVVAADLGVFFESAVA